MSILLERCGENEGQISMGIMPLLLLPMKQHASRIIKPKLKRGSVAPCRELWTTVTLLRKSESKTKQNITKPKTSSPVHDGMKPGFNVHFCLESQKSNKCQAF